MVFLGAAQMFTPTVTGTANTGVLWSVNGITGGNATVGTVSAAGLYTAPANLPMPAAVTVTATSAADASKSASASVTIQSDVTVAVMPAAPAVELGATQPFTATVTGSGMPNTAVTWSVNGIAGGNSTVGTVSAGGLYTAPRILPAPAVVNVAATSAADTAKSGGASVTITSSLMVTVSGATSVNTGDMTQYMATVVPAPMSNPDLSVQWSVDGVPGGNAIVGTIDAAGLYTAPLLAPAGGMVTVAAMSVADPSKTGSVLVTVNAFISVSISPAPSASVPLEGMQIFTPTVSGTPNTAVVWDVNGIVGGDQNTVGAISNPGSGPATYFAPLNMPAAGTTITVRATSQADSSKSATATVNLFSNIVVLATAVTGASSSVRAVGRRETLCAAIANTSNPALVWAVDGIVNGNSTVGQIVPPQGSSPPCPVIGPAGSLQFTMDYVTPAAVPATNPVTITVSSVADPGQSADVTITIVPAVTVSVAPSAVSVVPGGMQQFSATVNGTADQSVAWAVSGTDCSAGPCGTITGAGLYAALSNAVPQSTDTVQATSTDGGAVGTASVTIASTAPAITSLQPASLSAGVAAGFTLRVLGVNFGPGAEILFNGAAKATTCPSSSECTASINPADVATAGSQSIQVRLPGPMLSNAVSLVVADPADMEEVISLSAGAPVASGKDVSVVEQAPAVGTLAADTMALGILAGGVCSASGGPITITRPASGIAQVEICAGNAEVTHAYTLSGPPTPDVTISSVVALALGVVQVRITFLVPSTAQTGVRTLSAEDGNRNRTVAAGAILIR
jgi:hypothetical protein